MKKLRATFGILGALTIALATFLAFSVYRAVEAERAARHRVVAERVFDEMERKLTAILERDHRRAQSGERATAEPAAIGYFEVYTNGHTFGSTPAALAIARGFERRGAARGQVPGTTIRIGGSTDEIPGYGAITALNRGALRDEAGGFGFGAYEGQVERGHLLFFRRIESGSRWHIEGVAIDRDLLEAELARTLDEAQIEARSFSLSPDRAPVDPYVFRHRFGAPFEGLHADLSLAPLPDPPANDLTQILAVFLLFALAISLYAAYRTSAARVRLAEKQSRFVAAVTHELRTPLTTLRMYSEMLRDGIAPPEAQREYYDAMVLESERLGRLVDNVLSHAKADRQSVRLEPLAIGPIALRVIALLEPQARARGCSLEPTIDRELPLAIADRDAVAQVLVNLLDNALVHGEAGPVELVCERRGSRIGVIVRDHGPGLPDALLEDVFAPFVSRDPSGRGVGLGLSLVRSLATRMDAEVFAENAPGGGLRVALLLRAA